MKSLLPCPGCGAPVVYKKLKRHNKETKIATPKPILCCYLYECVCGQQSTFDPEAVKSAWDQEQLMKRKRI